MNPRPTDRKFNALYWLHYQRLVATNITRSCRRTDLGAVSSRTHRTQRNVNATSTQATQRMQELALTVCWSLRCLRCVRCVKFYASILCVEYVAFGWRPRLKPGTVKHEHLVFSERELMFTFAICCSPSVCLSSVCNVRAPYSGG